MKNAELKANVKKKIHGILVFLKFNTWVFTIIFSFFALCFSVFVWYDAFYKPVPSEQVIQEVNGNRKNFDQLKSSTEGAIETLKEKVRLYQQGPQIEGQRELFITIDDDDFMNKLKPSALIESDQVTGAETLTEEIEVGGAEEDLAEEEISGDQNTPGTLQ